MSGTDVTYMLRIAGVGDGNGQIVWTTRPLPYALSATVYAGGLSSVPDVLRHEVGVLDPVGSDAGIGVSLIYSLGGSVLLDSRIAVAQDVDGATLRLAEGLSSTGVNLVTDTEPDLALSDFVWIRGEAMKVAAAPAASGDQWSTLVARGQIGTIAQSIAETVPGPIVCTQWPGVIGSRVTLSRVSMAATSSAAEEVIYRGVIGAVSSRGPEVELQIGSTLAALRDTPYTLPAAESTGDEWGTVGVVSGDGSSGILFVLPDGAAAIPWKLFGWFEGGAVSHAWLALEEVDSGSRKALCLVSVSIVSDAIRVGTLEQCYLDERRVAPGVAYPALLNGTWRLVDARLADTIATTTPAGVIVELLTGKARPGVRGGLSTDQVDVNSLDTITRVARVAEVGSGEIYSGGTLFVMPYRDKPAKIREVLDELLLPLGVSIAPGRDGRIRAIDWGQSTLDAVAVQPSDLRAGLTGWSLSDANALREVTLRATRDGQELTARIVSDLAANVTTGGRVLEIDAGVWGLTSARWRAVQDRWSTLLALWQRSAPELTLEVSRSLALDVGDLVRLPIPSLVSWDGARYDATAGNEIYAVVTGVSPRLRSPVDEMRVTAYGWGVARADGVWGPAAKVTSVSSSTRFNVGDRYTDDDAQAFTVGMRVIAVDATGRRIDTNDPPVAIAAIAAGQLTITPGLSASSQPDAFVACDSTDQEADGLGILYGGTYWADDDDAQADVTKGIYTYS